MLTLLQSLGSAPPTGLSPTLVSLARQGIQRIIGPDAKEQSPEQLQLLVDMLDGKGDMLVVIGTGGGKSMAWLVPAVMDPDGASIVVVPFTALLQQHLSNARRHGIICEKWTTASKISGKFQILFLQPESARTTKFKE